MNACAMLIFTLALSVVTVGHAEERWHSRQGETGFPFTGHWDGYRTWKPDVPRHWGWPEKIVIDRPGKCEVRCERSGRWEYRCREYRC